MSDRLAGMCESAGLLKPASETPSLGRFGSVRNCDDSAGDAWMGHIHCGGTNQPTLSPYPRRSLATGEQYDDTRMAQGLDIERLRLKRLRGFNGAGSPEDVSAVDAHLSLTG